MNSELELKKQSDELSEACATAGNLGIAFAIQRVENANHRCKFLEGQVQSLSDENMKLKGKIRGLETTISEVNQRIDKVRDWAKKFEKANLKDRTTGH